MGVKQFRRVVIVLKSQGRTSSVEPLLIPRGLATGFFIHNLFRVSIFEIRISFFAVLAFLRLRSGQAWREKF